MFESHYNFSNNLDYNKLLWPFLSALTSKFKTHAHIHLGWFITENKDREHPEILGKA